MARIVCITHTGTDDRQAQAEALEAFLRAARDEQERKAEQPEPRAEKEAA